MFVHDKNITYDVQVYKKHQCIFLSTSGTMAQTLDSLHAYTDQTCLKWNLVIMETCLKHETFTVPRIQTSSTCINWNKPAVKKKFDPLWFLHRHVSVFQVLVPRHK